MQVKQGGLLQFPLNEIMQVEQACHAFPWSEKTMQSCLHGRYFNTTIVDGNTLVGFYVAERAGPDLTLMDICIRPNYQGKGCAKPLMEDLLAQAESLQAENIFLEVRASNTAAIALYHRYGFVEMGLRKNYYPSTHGREDAMLMALPLA
ncbi:ribosomal-protein-alanine N-acetyltransferase [Pseudoalteromonas piscicida]|uniref:[Ribosomal protein bS18]-alanine N-acetyltransferase n=1 Tax=Pseudoalteromonas piscicida TaxID=43662 RepID=A0AAQ2IT35_PSEO7|nr:MULTISPECIES: ribosomal protein S18-alanine N-acetyltransferase [Pseudoalteromonas]KJY90858.1 alanine acetyltransferase [Pseudoalteromonas piscicida]MDP4488252.1 ribosomal protein S18-alanine N-acetyltransferase [Pseudoalteromonas piscicida]TMN42817.1 ribosomal-protein-alanine N-acetyltransferase [Pseudoalteromonas piscicida]TMN45536.1 ribosomal-protein-alanine N-acetyltransferase [Pseudoalteromonas piscicida]TMN50934.1 ribosomal-protein-alanine N-acetyltransferase [Pseudoalteromonas piscic